MSQAPSVSLSSFDAHLVFRSLEGNLFNGTCSKSAGEADQRGENLRGIFYSGYVASYLSYLIFS